jgi:hypothetical protein
MKHIPHGSGGASPGSIVPATNDALAQPWKHIAWQKLWLATQRKDWRTLALVPGSKHGPVDYVKGVANILARTGMIHRGAPVRVTDGTGLALHDLINFMEQVQRCVSYGDRVILALDAISENPASVPVAEASDGVVLCVALGETDMSAAQKTIDEIGRARFLGSILVGADGNPAP